MPSSRPDAHLLLGARGTTGALLYHGVGPRRQPVRLTQAAGAAAMRPWAVPDMAPKGGMLHQVSASLDTCAIAQLIRAVLRETPSAPWLRLAEEVRSGLRSSEHLQAMPAVTAE